MREAALLLLGLTIWISSPHYGQAEIQITNDDFYSVINTSLTQTSVNCTQYIPNNWREVMMRTQPPRDLADGQMLVLLKPLLACLHGELTHMNESSPFSLTPRPEILYSMALCEVASLSFEGILVTKAKNFLQNLSCERTLFYSYVHLCVRRL